jgi:asparagine synthase (glutamine-hydrolysing)
MKKIRIQLTDRRWLHDATQCAIHFRGAAFADGVMHRTPEEIGKRLPQPGKDAQICGKAVSALNGFFALIWHAEEQAVAAVDRVRSIPLFYGKNSDAVFISDDAEWIRQQVGDEDMDRIARDEFQLTGYVTGRDTLYPNVKQLQAGELLIVDATGAAPVCIITYRYYRFLHVEPLAHDERVLTQGLEHSATAGIRRLIDYADGRQIVIPLSGGYDSRLIATLLRKLGHKKILTFSYGIKGNKESAYSRHVAEALGLPWHFVEYSAENWRSAWNTEQRAQYQRWATGWAGIAHIQDWVAVRALHSDGIVDWDCIFVPGHSGDFVAGSHIPDEAFQDAPVSIDMLVEKILRTHYVRSTSKSGPRAKFGVWKKRVIDRAEVRKIVSQSELASAFEKWDWQERQAKFVVNAVRVYEFFGYDWWLPLWDGEFMEFWQGVPLALREKRHWYLAYVKRAYASQIDVDVENALSLRNASDIGFLSRSVRSIVGIFPPGVKDYLKTLQHRVAPKRITNAYGLAHLPLSEINRLQREGYRGDDMLVHEFLRMVSK